MSDYSKEVLAGFVEEAQSYLPIILKNTEVFIESGGEGTAELMEEAYRHAHTIKGAAAMIGLAPLSHMAYYLEEVLADLATGVVKPDAVGEYVPTAVGQLETYLSGVVDKSYNEAELLVESTYAYNDMRGITTDMAMITELMQSVSFDESASAEIPDMSDFTDAGMSDEELMAMADTMEIADSGAEPLGDSFSMMEFDAEFMAELREAFNEEAEDHLRNSARLLAYLDKQPSDKEQLRELRRVIHTLKGAAATVGLNQMAQVSHKMEDLLDHIDEVGSSVSRPVMDLLFDSADLLEDQLQDDVPEDRHTTLLARYDTVLVSDKGNFSQPQAETVDLYEFNSPESVEEAATEEAEPVTVENAIVEEEVVEAPVVAEAASIDETPALEEMVVETEEVSEVKTPAVEKAVAKDAAKPQEAAPIRTTSEVVRVPLERLDELVRMTSEFVITRTTLEQRINDLTRFINEIAPSLERLQRISGRLDTDYQELSYASQNATMVDGMPVARIAGGGSTGKGLAIGPDDQTGGFVQSEFDALEFDRYTELYMLSRELSETTSDIKTIHGDLTGLLGDFDSILTRQSRVSSEVQDKLMRTRMVPLSNIVTRLQRAVRLVSRKTNKDVDLVVEGEHIELDKKVLEEIADPLLHLLRNSVDHGIEPTALRVATGKGERGTITLRAYYEGNQVIVQVLDDGAGIDLNKIRLKAVKSGYLSESEAATIPDSDLYQLIFQSGFSTADEVSDISGRGVGMDAVRTSINRLKGTISLDSTQGEGVTFTIRLPLTLAVMRALLIRVRGSEYALPLSSVSQIMRLEGEKVDNIGKNPVIHVNDKVLPLMQMGEMLGMPAVETLDSKRTPVLVLNTGTRQVAVTVDEILEGREIVIKTLGSHLRYVHGVTGATLMGDGRVVLILNPAELGESREKQSARKWTQAEDGTTPTASAATAKKVLDILVVDDSVSVRKVVANMVKNAGWNPTMARDGLEALETIQASAISPDAILLDIEMPRMNGYELSATLRASDSYKDIPIIMLTSRAGEKHRQKAFELGVNDYLVKPYREEDLMAAVKKVTS